MSVITRRYIHLHWPYIGLIDGRYLHFRILKFPLIRSTICNPLGPVRLGVAGSLHLFPFPEPRQPHLTPFLAAAGDSGRVQDRVRRGLEVLWVEQWMCCWLKLCVLMILMFFVFVVFPWVSVFFVWHVLFDVVSVMFSDFSVWWSFWQGKPSGTQKWAQVDWDRCSFCPKKILHHYFASFFPK